MNFLGIGPLELVFIIILLLIIFGPKELQNAGKTIGQGLRKIIHSETWKSIVQTSNTIRELPNELIRQAEIDEITKTYNQVNQTIGSPDFIKPETDSKILIPDALSEDPIPPNRQKEP